MYAKSLFPTTPPTASLLATTSLGDELFAQLIDSGWASFADPGPRPAQGHLQVTPDGLRVVAEWQVLLSDDTNAVGPPGWWEAVDRRGQTCVVLVMRAADIDLNRPDCGEVVVELVSRGRGVWAIPTVQSSPTGALEVPGPDQHAAGAHVSLAHGPVDAMIDRVRAEHPGVEFTVFTSPADSLLVPKDSDMLWRGGRYYSGHV